MRDLLLCVHVVVETLNMEIPRCRLTDTSDNSSKVRAARAARLFFLIQPIGSLFPQWRCLCRCRRLCLSSLKACMAKLGNIVAETMFLVMFPGVAKLGNIRFGRKICVREDKMFLTPGKNIICFPSSKICFRNTCFPRG